MMHLYNKKRKRRKKIERAVSYAFDLQEDGFSIEESYEISLKEFKLQQKDMEQHVDYLQKKHNIKPKSWISLLFSHIF